MSAARPSCHKSQWTEGQMGTRVAPPGSATIVRIEAECDECDERFSDQRGIFVHILNARHIVSGTFYPDDGSRSVLVTELPADDLKETP